MRARASLQQRALALRLADELRCDLLARARGPRRTPGPTRRGAPPAPAPATRSSRRRRRSAHSMPRSGSCVVDHLDVVAEIAEDADRALHLAPDVVLHERVAERLADARSGGAPGCARARPHRRCRAAAGSRGRIGSGPATASRKSAASRTRARDRPVADRVDPRQHVPRAHARRSAPARTSASDRRRRHSRPGCESEPPPSEAVDERHHAGGDRRRRAAARPAGRALRDSRDCGITPKSRFLVRPV